MAAGCYDDLYLPASFKGVPFDAIDATSEHGRRGATGEFPFGEQTAYADMGRRIRNYTLSGRFVENSHIADAQALIAACESTGPGTLVHPSRGAIRVACKMLKVRDEVLEGKGITLVDMEFVEANEWISGISLTNSLSGLSIAPLLSLAQTFFTSRYSVTNAPFHRVVELRETSTGAVQRARQGFQEAVAGLDDEDTFRALADLDFLSGDTTTIDDPEGLHKVISQTFAAIDARSVGDQKVAIFRDMANWAAQSGSGLIADQENAIYGLFRMSAAAYIARGVLETEPTTLDAALLQYDMVVSLVNQEIESARVECDNCLLLELRGFLSEVQGVLLDRAYNLPPLVVYDFGGSVHALQAAHEIFGDAKLHRKIETRNPQYLPWSVGPRVIATRQ